MVTQRETEPDKAPLTQREPEPDEAPQEEVQLVDIQLDEDNLEKEEHDAASGALGGVVGQATLAAMTAERQETVETDDAASGALGGEVHRQVHFRDFARWPDEKRLWMCSARLTTKRRRRNARFINTMKEHHTYPVPKPEEFITGVLHMNNSKRDELWDAVRAIASTKMHFLELLKKVKRRENR